MKENDKILEDFEKPWEEKLAEAKAKSGTALDDEQNNEDEEQKFQNLEQNDSTKEESSEFTREPSSHT